MSKRSEPAEERKQERYGNTVSFHMNLLLHLVSLNSIIIAYDPKKLLDATHKLIGSGETGCLADRHSWDRENLALPDGSPGPVF